MSRRQFEVDLDEMSPDDWEKFMEELNKALDEEPAPQTATPETAPVMYPWMQYIVFPQGDDS